MKPYTYLIGWSERNLWYYGCQYGRNSTPSNLWTLYFTSSKEVKRLRATIGEPDVIQIRKVFETPHDCIKWEGTVLRRLSLKDRGKWLNKTYIDPTGVLRFVFTGLSEETKKRMSESWSNGRRKNVHPRAWNKGIPMTEEARQHLSEVNTGKKRDPSWNKTGPKKGSKQSDEHKANRLKKFKETLQTPEMKAKKSAATTGRRFYTDGSRRYLLKPDDAKIQQLNLRIGF